MTFDQNPGRRRAPRCSGGADCTRKREPSIQQPCGKIVFDVLDEQQRNHRGWRGVRKKEWRTWNQRDGRQIIWGLLVQGRNTDFYFEWEEKPLVSFNLGSDIVWYVSKVPSGGIGANMEERRTIRSYNHRFGKQRIVPFQDSGMNMVRSDWILNEFWRWNKQNSLGHLHWGMKEREESRKILQFGA